MRKNLQLKIQKMLEEESKAPLDENLLDQLREATAQETHYFTLEPAVRNAFNAFFREVKDVMMSEILTGKYGADIVVDQVIVATFEAGMNYANMKKGSE